MTENHDRHDSSGSVKTIKLWYFKLLSKRPYTRAQLAGKSLAKGYLKKDFEPVLDYFETRGWIDDYQFAIAYAQDGYSISGWGPRKIQWQLAIKGVDKATISRVMDDIEWDENPLYKLQEILRKKKTSLLREKDTFKRRKKIVDYLSRKGYDADDIFPYLDNLMKFLDE